MKFQINLDRLLGELDHLASLTDCVWPPDPSLFHPQRAVTRIVFTERDREARAWLTSLAARAGLAKREDAVGNTFFRWAGSEPALAPVGTGSHIDAIPFAGMYDGTLGVVGGLEAIRALQEAGFAPRRSIELVLFTSEEPTRFGVGCLGSRLLGGALDPEAADALVDRLQETDPEAPVGKSLAGVRQAAGFTGSLATVPLARGAYAAWLELHIEQGPLLEKCGEDLGVVTHIAGPASDRFTIKGLGGHAGALLMPDRRDALCAAAEIVLAVEQAVLAANQAAGASDAVGTVGKLDVFPGAVNAVPSCVTFTLDLRDIDAHRRDGIMTRIRFAIEAIQRRRDVLVSQESINADDPAVCDPELIRLLTRVAESEGARVRPMISRAYHDTSFMARIAPVAMLFVPSRAGVSHRPDEYTGQESIALGVRTLAGALAELSRRPDLPGLTGG